MFDFNKPLWINWELNNICNLMCPQCTRNEIVDGELIKKDNLDNYDNSLQTFMRVYENIGHRVSLIRFQGQLSENVASQDFLPICEYIIENKTIVGVSTNGSLRSTNFWYELGKAFSKCRNNKQRSHIIFCIDGVGPELELYRINANYNKIIENAQAFMEGGGEAWWRMIIFKHNQHQVEAAEKEAKRLGFSEFVATHTNRRNALEPFKYKGKDYQLEIQDIDDDYNKKVEINLSNFSQEPISCKAVNENQFYVNHKNKVWACYYIPDFKSLADEQDWYQEYYEDDSNNLEEKTLDEILENKFYDALQMSWDVESKCLSLCKQNCSVKKGLTRQFKFASGKILTDRSDRNIQSYE